MLLEVLRRLWLRIYVRKIVHHWEVHQTLTHSQHGFRRGHWHRTESALLVHLNCLEHARHTNFPLFLSSWDIRRAFDSVSKKAIDASWHRLGVPALKEGQRILLNISTWATQGVTTLWTHFKEHVHDLEPLPTLPTILPNAHTGYTEPLAPVMDFSASETPGRAARASPSPLPKRRRLDRPPPEPPQLTPRQPLTDHARWSPTAFILAPISLCSPRTPRSPWTTLEGADHG